MDFNSTATMYFGEKSCLSGENITKKATLLASLEGIFADKEAFNKLAGDTEIYWVETHDNGLSEGKKGGLFFGISHVLSGKIGNEYYMTRGHVHNVADTGEYYWGLKGDGLLVKVNLAGETVIEKVEKGSLHYIPGNTAHRLVNTGAEELAVGACWLSESGHNYNNSKKLFPIRIVEKDGKPTIIDD